MTTRVHQRGGASQRTQAKTVRHAIKKISVGTNGKLPSDGVVAMTITPEIAGDWLGHNTANRKVRDFRAVKLAEEIRAGRWFPLNGETIKFSPDGVLLDGQHRLLACIIADSPIETYAAFGVDAAAFKTIDQGFKRSVKDALYVAGEAEDIGQLAAALNAMYRWLTSGSFIFATAPSTEEALDILRMSPGLRESVKVAKRLKKRVPGVSWGLFGCLHYLMNEVDAEDCSYFFEKLIDGVGLASDDPIYHLRERLLRPLGAAGTGFRQQQEIAVLTVKAWNAFRASKMFTSRSLRYWPDEAVPEIV